MFFSFLRTLTSSWPQAAQAHNLLKHPGLQLIHAWELHGTPSLVGWVLLQARVL